MSQAGFEPPFSKENNLLNKKVSALTNQEINLKPFALSDL